MIALMIGLDSTLAMDKDKVVGDSQERHILYGKYVSQLFIVVNSAKKMNLKVKRLSDNIIVYPTSSKRFSFIWDAHRIGKNICRDNKIDIITTQDPFLAGLVGHWLKRRFSIPLNIQIHADFLDNTYWIQETIMNYFLNKLGKWLVKKADSLRVVSSEIEQDLVKLGISGDKIGNVPTGGGIEVHRFMNLDGSPVRERYLPDPSFDKLVLFVGRLCKQKNIPNLLRAMSLILQNHPEVLLLIAGNGEEKNYVAKIYEDLTIMDRVTFTGAVSYKQIPYYYAACDLFVLPSNYEGTARVLEEAAVAGKPIVTTDVSGAREVVVDGATGYVVGLDNYHELAEKVVNILDNPELGKEMGEKGQKHILQKYDRVKNIPKVIELWEKTVEDARLGAKKYG